MNTILAATSWSDTAIAIAGLALVAFIFWVDRD